MTDFDPGTQGKIMRLQGLIQHHEGIIEGLTMAVDVLRDEPPAPARFVAIVAAGPQASKDETPPADNEPAFFVDGEELTWLALREAAGQLGFSWQTASVVWRFLRSEALATFMEERKLYPLMRANEDAVVVDLQALHNAVMDPDFDAWLRTVLAPESKGYELFNRFTGVSRT